MQQLDLSIAGLSLRMESDQPFRMNDRFLPFVIQATDPDLTVRFQRVEHLPALPETLLHEDLCYRVHADGCGRALRSFFDAPRDMSPYAVSFRDPESHQLRIHYLQKGAPCIREMSSCFFHLGLESLLLSRGRLCLHAACIRTELGGILFSGPSGIGKSTQAELWRLHRGAELINGDRPILSRDEREWLAWGSPYAGSSRCHINDSCAVRAIVMLRQAPSCTLRRLGPGAAFRAVWSGLTVNSWDAEQVRTATDLALELTASVPVYELACTPDEAAVALLEQQLRKEELS